MCLALPIKTVEPLLPARGIFYPRCTFFFAGYGNLFFYHHCFIHCIAVVSVNDKDAVYIRQRYNYIYNRIFNVYMAKQQINIVSTTRIEALKTKAVSTGINFNWT